MSEDIHEEPRWVVVTPHAGMGWAVGDVIRLHREGEGWRITQHRELNVPVPDVLAALASSGVPAPLPVPPPLPARRVKGHLRLVG